MEFKILNLKWLCKTSVSITATSVAAASTIPVKDATAAEN